MVVEAEPLATGTGARAVPSTAKVTVPEGTPKAELIAADQEIAGSIDRDRVRSRGCGGDGGSGKGLSVNPNDCACAAIGHEDVVAGIDSETGR